MTTFAKLFASVLDRNEDGDRSRARAVHREWDRQRARAISAADLSEIDAIFSRAL